MAEVLSGCAVRAEIQLERSGVEAEITRLRNAHEYMLGALRCVVAETKGRSELNHINSIAQAGIDLATQGERGCAEMRGDARQSVS